MSVERFRAILGGEEGERPVVELPFDAKERFGKARAPVRGAVSVAGRRNAPGARGKGTASTPFRTTVAVYGGRYYIGFNREIRDLADIALGDEVEVGIELDDELRTVDVPPALYQALASDRQASAAFERLSFSHRKGYASWIAEAKRDDTRTRRVEQALEMLREGVPHP